jgi:KaiC/GvpD/RAD55 family RecA-like ATPase
MKIVLDTIVEHKGRHVAYVQLRQDDDTILATTSMYYDGAKATEEAKVVILEKFKEAIKKELAKEALLVESRTALEKAIAEIDIKAVSKEEVKE